MTIHRLTPLGSKLVAATSVLFVVAGSVLIFFVRPTEKLAEKPDFPIVVKSSIQASSEITPHDLLPKKVTPSVPKKPKPRKSVHPVSTPSSTSAPGTVSTKPTTPSPVASTPTSVPSPTKPVPQPSVKPTTPSPRPTAPSSSPVPQPSTVWYTDATAVSAAQRMAATGTVGDLICSLAAYGEPDPSQVPSNVSRVGVGEYNNYWCLIW